MSHPTNLKDVYIEELRDLWSANDQMQEVLPEMAAHAKSPKLKSMLQKSISGVAKHTQVLKSLVESNGGKVAKDHCKGMEGLVAEALKHGVHEAPKDGELRDIAIVTQYQRMSHYGITGFGSVASLAEALGKQDAVKTLKGIVADIYKADEYSSHLGESAAKKAAK